jgi:hypothetical protein
VHNILTKEPTLTVIIGTEFIAEQLKSIFKVEAKSL